MKKTVRIRGLEIGSGMPKICVPVAGRTREEILEKAVATVEARPDLVEWRIDFYEELTDENSRAVMLTELGKVLQGIPLLVTLRTDREGSNTHVSGEDYEQILCHLATLSQTDLLDVEVLQDRESARRIIACARKNHKAVVGSNHHFEGTPADEAIDEIFAAMEADDADILKLAVMPQSREDVLRLMAKTLAWDEKTDCPLITMSMGSLGCISRMCGELTGSSVTFASVTEASAPGQIDKKQLENILILLHR